MTRIFNANYISSKSFKDPFHFMSDVLCLIFVNPNLGGIIRGGAFWGWAGGEGGVKLSPRLKLVRIMIETWHFTYTQTHM